jgi:hypothetical protein
MAKDCRLDEKSVYVCNNVFFQQDINIKVNELCKMG